MASASDQPQLMYPAPLATGQVAAIDLNTEIKIDFETPILIVGGGPVGMLQALILARLHDQTCMLIERETTTTIYPKMEYTNGRSMEIYRLMGLHEELRAVATAEVPEKYNNDELIVTSLVQGGKLVHVWERDGAEAQRKKSKSLNDGSQYVEPHMRCHQIIIEKWLKEKVKADKRIQSHWGTAFVTLAETPDHVLTQVQKSDSTTLTIKSQYVIGCDGGGSRVRKSVNLESKREYQNLSMAFVHFRSSALRAAIPFPHFWHANVLSGGGVVSQNEADLWTVHLMLPPGTDPAGLSEAEIVARAVGGCQGPVPVATDEVLCRGTWRVDIAIADGFRSRGPAGRVFLAGDSAHQLSPIGGHGLNSGLGDAFDLAWKLVARVRGWGGEGLLESYDVERRQIAFENLGHVQRGLGEVVMPMFTSHLKYGMEVLQGEGEEAERVRAEIAEVVERGYWLHDQNGNILGYSYKQSPIVMEGQEVGERPKGTTQTYIPTTWPGSQAPRVWMKDGKSTSDALSGDSFNLVDFSADGRLSKPFVEAADQLGMPMRVLRWHEEDVVRSIYEKELVLIRPDTHVAWRSPDGVTKPSTEDATRILKFVSGHKV